MNNNDRNQNLVDKAMNTRKGRTKLHRRKICVMKRLLRNVYRGEWRKMVQRLSKIMKAGREVKAN